MPHLTLMTPDLKLIAGKESTKEVIFIFRYHSMYAISGTLQFSKKPKLNFKVKFVN